MEKSYARLIENNKTWVAEQLQLDPSFFENLSKGQAPEYLWIGCSDSRVPAESITGTEPGEMFVHRNIANMVVHTDVNLLSVLDYAVTHLKVKHVVVCGHYECGGVKASLQPVDLGILNPWLRNIRDVYRIHQNELDGITDEHLRFDRLVELNVQEQCINVIKTAAVQKAYKERGLTVQGWVFDVRTGKLKDLNINFKEILANIMKIYNLE